MAKPTSKHRPEYSTLQATQAGIDGRNRYMFYVTSKSNPDLPHVYMVNDDGTAPYCSCRDDNEWARDCYLCQPEIAREMAERGRKMAAGESVPVGF